MACVGIALLFHFEVSSDDFGCIFDRSNGIIIAEIMEKLFIRTIKHLARTDIAESMKNVSDF